MRIRSTRAQGNIYVGSGYGSLGPGEVADVPTELACQLIHGGNIVFEEPLPVAAGKAKPAPPTETADSPKDPPSADTVGPPAPPSKPPAKPRAPAKPRSRSKGR